MSRPRFRSFARNPASCKRRHVSARHTASIITILLCHTLLVYNMPSSASNVFHGRAPFDTHILNTHALSRTRAGATEAHSSSLVSQFIMMYHFACVGCRCICIGYRCWMRGRAFVFSACSHAIIEAAFSLYLNNTHYCRLATAWI